MIPEHILQQFCAEITDVRITAVQFSEKMNNFLDKWVNSEEDYQLMLSHVHETLAQVEKEWDDAQAEDLIRSVSGN